MLYKIRLELARNKEFPNGSPAHGYELIAPLTGDGHLDEAAWRAHKQACKVRRFWPGQGDEHGRIERKGDRWLFSYAPGTDDDEPIFRLGLHVFKPGEYISITEHDGVLRTFTVASAKPAALPA